MRYVVFILMLVVTACRADETITGQTDPKEQWEMLTMFGVEPSAPVTIAFPAKGEFSSVGPCNQFRARQLAPLPWFQLGPIAGTKRACPELAFETEYLDMLARANLIEIKGETLILSIDEGDAAIFKRIEP